MPHLSQERSYQPVEPVESMMGSCSEHAYFLSRGLTGNHPYLPG